MKKWSDEILVILIQYFLLHRNITLSHREQVFIFVNKRLIIYCMFTVFFISERFRPRFTKQPLSDVVSQLSIHNCKLVSVQFFL